MDRRKFLVNTFALFGINLYSINSLVIDSALAYTGDITSRLSKKQQQLISIIADIIIPETDTPSATQAGVVSYIDFYLHEFLSSNSRTTLLDGLEQNFDTRAVFVHLPPNKQVAIIEQLDAQLFTEKENAIYKHIKQLVVIGYYTSEVGATQALQYDPVPGPYKEMKLKDVGRVWA